MAERGISGSQGLQHLMEKPHIIHWLQLLPWKSQLRFRCESGNLQGCHSNEIVKLQRVKAGAAESAAAPAHPEPAAPAGESQLGWAGSQSPKIPKAPGLAVPQGHWAEPEVANGSWRAVLATPGHIQHSPKYFNERRSGSVFSSAAAENKGKGQKKHRDYLCEILIPTEPSSAEFPLGGAAEKVPFLIWKFWGKVSTGWNIHLGRTLPQGSGSLISSAAFKEQLRATAGDQNHCFLVDQTQLKWQILLDQSQV